MLIARLDESDPADSDSVPGNGPDGALTVRSLLAEGADAVTIVPGDQPFGWCGDWFFVDDRRSGTDADRGAVVGQVVAAVLGGAAVVCCQHPRPVRRVLDGLAQVASCAPDTSDRAENANGG